MKRHMQEILAGGAGSACREDELRRCVAGLIVAALLALAGCSRAVKEGPGGTRVGGAVPVRVAAALRTNVPVQLRAIGHVTPFSTVSVESRVDGILQQVHFEQGGFVKEESLLFTIDPRPFQAALNQAKANLERDKANARYAELEVERNGTLFRERIIPQDTLDQSRASADAAKATVAADQAAVETAELQLSFCFIHSPVNGRAGTLKVNAGNAVKNLDTMLVTLNQTEPIYVDFSVPEHELPAIRASLAERGKLPVAAVATGHEKDPVAGELTIINNTVDPNTGTILLRALFPNLDQLLWPGQFVNTVFTVNTLTNAVVVPTGAIQAGQQGPYVFVVKADWTVEARPVEVSNVTGLETVLRDGLEGGEQVVTSGQVRLSPGAKVRVENSAPGVVAGGSGKPAASNLSQAP